MIRKVSLATRLALLVAGTTLSMILFAAGVIYLNHMHEREAAFGRPSDTVRGIRLVLDAEMQGAAASWRARHLPFTAASLMDYHPRPESQ